MAADIFETYVVTMVAAMILINILFGDNKLVYLSIYIFILLIMIDYRGMFIIKICN